MSKKKKHEKHFPLSWQEFIYLVGSLAHPVSFDLPRICGACLCKGGGSGSRLPFVRAAAEMWPHQIYHCGSVFFATPAIKTSGLVLVLVACVLDVGYLGEGVDVTFWSTTTATMWFVIWWGHHVCQVWLFNDVELRSSNIGLNWPQTDIQKENGSVVHILLLGVPAFAPKYETAADLTGQSIIPIS